jgi:hypothetical protein
MMIVNKKMKIYSSASIEANPMLPAVLVSYTAIVLPLIAPLFENLL